MLLDVPNRPQWRRMTLESENLVDELKFYSDFRSATNLTAFTELTNMLPEIARGTQENQRIGNLISVNWINLSYIINTRNEAIAAPSDGLVRVMIVVDHQSNATTPTFAQIVDTSIGFTNGPYNRDNVPQRFEILHDEVVHIRTGNVTYGGGVPVYSNGLGYKDGSITLIGGPINVRFNDEVAERDRIQYEEYQERVRKANARKARRAKEVVLNVYPSGQALTQDDLEMVDIVNELQRPD